MPLPMIAPRTGTNLHVPRPVDATAALSHLKNTSNPRKPTVWSIHKYLTLRYLTEVGRLHGH
jgi:hypothetical protein